MKVLPSTSVSVAPLAEAAMIGNVTASGLATTCARRSPISRERGPGISVRKSIALVATMQSG